MLAAITRKKIKHASTHHVTHVENVFGFNKSNSSSQYSANFYASFVNEVTAKIVEPLKATMDAPPTSNKAAQEFHEALSEEVYSFKSEHIANGPHAHDVHGPLDKNVV